MLDDARRFGMDEASIAELAATLAGDEEQTGIWPEHVAIVEAFLAASTQWRVVTLGGGYAPPVPLYIGLDYSAVRIALDAEGISVTKKLWSGLRVMEIEALAALNEVRS